MTAQRSRRAPAEPLSARVLRYRIARGYSPSDLASAAGVWTGAIRRLESGRPVDKRMLAPLSAALGVPLCRLVCGEHSCAQRACAPASRLDAAPELPGRRGSGAFAFTTPLRRWTRRRTPLAAHPAIEVLMHLNRGGDRAACPAFPGYEHVEPLAGLQERGDLLERHRGLQGQRVDPARK